MKDYFHSRNETDSFKDDDYKIHLGPFDGLTDCSLSINPGIFTFLAGNYLGTQ